MSITFGSPQNCTGKGLGSLALIQNKWCMRDIRVSEFQEDYNAWQSLEDYKKSTDQVKV